MMLLTAVIWRLRVTVHNLTAPAAVEAPRQGRRQMAAVIPRENPLATGVAGEERNEAALRLVDPDVYGYLLLTVHKPAHEPYADIRLAAHLEDSWWPAVDATLADVVSAGYGE